MRKNIIIERIMRDAADLIDQRGLTKGELCDSEGRLCLRGAVLVAAGAMVTSEPEVMVTTTAEWAYPGSTVALVYDVERRLGFADDGSAVAWNNDPERTGTEVSDLLRSRSH
jgi:hypothetical protein